ncbi:MAG: nucleoside diphosphate kinase regulator [Bacteriovoracaceae bacterium]|nr:transcription elongation factor GreAB [Halobacteriovoraceae bacterium]MDP7321535.1 nucleoside diphosphate kinase regulator [Bacteriovoracaceae bacterium]
METGRIFITEKDYLRLTNLMGSHTDHNFEDLEIELDRASIISDNDVPKDLVTMNSKIKFLDLKTNKDSIITIVYPQNSNTNEAKISIFAPLGSALIGLKKNQEINWKFPNGKTKSLKVLEILYQPEAAEDWHL